MVKGFGFRTQDLGHRACALPGIAFSSLERILKQSLLGFFTKDYGDIMAARRLKVVPTKTANMLFVIVAPVAKGNQKAYGVYMTQAEYQKLSGLSPSSLPMSYGISKTPGYYIHKNPRVSRRVHVVKVPKGTTISMGSSVPGNAVSNVIPMSKMRFVIIAPRKWRARGNNRQFFGVFADPQEYRKYATKTGFDFARFLRDTGKQISSVWLPKTTSTTPGTSIVGNRPHIVLFNDSVTLPQAMKGGTKMTRSLHRRFLNRTRP